MLYNGLTVYLSVLNTYTLFLHTLVGQETETPASEDSQLSFLNDISSTSLSGILGTLSDSNFKQVADNGDVFEHIDFDDMFSQLKGVLSPEKGNSGGLQGPDQTIKQHDQCVRNTCKQCFNQEVFHVQ